MWVYLTLLAAICLLFLYFMYIKPTQQMKWYKKTFEAAGYKTYMMPYEMFGSSIYKSC